MRVVSGKEVVHVDKGHSWMGNAGEEQELLSEAVGMAVRTPSITVVFDV